jgi:D-lactate dehydrogenase
MVFAVRLDTFPKDPETRVFYIGTNDPAELTAIRRHILSRFKNLPVAGEYIHRDMFDIADVYGKDAFLAIQYLGANRLPMLFKLSRACDSFVSTDKLLQRLSRLLPDHLPARLRTYRDAFEHHLIVKMAGAGIGETVRYLRSIFPSVNGDFFKCTEEEATKAFLHRFVAAGAAIRYRAVHAQEVEDILALDIALKQNDRDWFERLPAEMHAQISHALYYGHFFCHVFHQDYVLRKGTNAAALKDRLLKLLDARGAECPAEHNVGHVYRAKPALADFYRRLDPSNSFNPGIGRTSKRLHWLPK